MTDLVYKVWTRYSFWKLSKDIFFSNNKNLEQTCGNIYGITDSLTDASSNMCASSYAIKLLNDKLATFN